MLRRMYDRLLVLAASRSAPAWLMLVAFCEGIFFPIPPDVMLMPMVLARREHAWRNAALCLVCSVAGGSVGYAIGYFLHPVAEWLVHVTGGNMASFKKIFDQWGLLLLATPLPYKLTAITSGVFQYNWLMFTGASLVIRGARFFLVAALIRTYGAPIQSFIEKRLALVVSAVAITVVAAVLALRFVH